MGGRPGVVQLQHAPLHRSSGQAERYDRDFQMDTAFINRVGDHARMAVRRPEVLSDWQVLVDSEDLTVRLVDGSARRRPGGPEHFVNTGLRFNLTRQGYVQVNRGPVRRRSLAEQFETGNLNVFANGQVLPLAARVRQCEQRAGIYYDPVSPFQGTGDRTELGVDLQPTSKFSQSLSYNYYGSIGARPASQVYGIHIVNLRDTYQFNSHFLLRAITQLDTSQRRILEDFLASYELVPGSVVHFGYSSIFDREFYHPYQASARGFFFKASYLARL
jgi:hypothetical protein